MYFLITVKNTGNYNEYMRAVNNFLNGYKVHESYVGSDHAHILIETNIMPDIQNYHRYYGCYIHFRKVRDFFADVERVKKYIRKHKEGVEESMDCGNVKVWVKKKEDGKVVMTLQMPEWYDLSENRAVITWNEDEFWQFVGYIASEVARQNCNEQGGTDANKRYTSKSGRSSKLGGSSKSTGKKSGRKYKRVKGFSKAVRGD